MARRERKRRQSAHRHERKQWRLAQRNGVIGWRRNRQLIAGIGSLAALWPQLAKSGEMTVARRSYQ